MPSLSNSLLADPAEFDTCRTGGNDQALANKVLLAFDTITTYQVIANSLQFKAKKALNISLTQMHTQKKKNCVILDLRKVY